MRVNILQSLFLAFFLLDFFLANNEGMEKEETNQSETIRLVRIDQLPTFHWLNQCNFGFSLADITLLSISTHQMRASWQRFLEMIDCKTLMDIKTENKF